MFDFKSILNKFKSTVPDSVYVPPVLLVPRKWVYWENQKLVGIIVDTKNYGTVRVHFVDAQGITTLDEEVRAGELRIARYDEIPAPRKIGISREYATSLGYY
jgi:hypothetical protein